MNILLISANTCKVPYPVYPLGLEYVAGMLPSRHQVKIIDMNLIRDVTDISGLIQDFNPQIIGLSIRNVDNVDIAESRDFVGEYRRLVDVIRGCSKARIVLGGSGFTIFAEELMTVLNGDFGVLGEGERFLSLVDALEKGENALGLAGVITGRCAPVMPDPWQSHITRRFEVGNPLVPFYFRHGGIFNLQTKRGCPFGCIYCTYTHIEGRILRRTPPEEVAQMAKTLEQAGAKYFFITDASFNSDYDHSRAVAKAFIQVGLSVPWGAFLTPTLPPPDYYRILADAGMTHVEFGTESLSAAMLTAYRKPFAVQDVFRTHDQAREAGLCIAHYFLLGGPGENDDTLSETYANVKKVNRSVFFFFCGVRIYPHTELYRIALADGQIANGQSLLDPVFFKPKGLSSAEIIQRTAAQAAGRSNWIIGSGGERTARILSRLYARGHTGPLWESLIA